MRFFETQCTLHDMDGRKAIKSNVTVLRSLAAAMTLYPYWKLWWRFSLIKGCPTCINDFCHLLSARQHTTCYSALYAIARPSVCPSIRPSLSSHGWISQKRLVMILQPSPQSSPMTLVSSRLTSPRNSKGNIGSGAPDERGVGKIGNF